MPEIPLNFIKVLNNDTYKIEKFLKDFYEVATKVPSYPFQWKILTRTIR